MRYAKSGQIGSLLHRTESRELNGGALCLPTSHNLKMFPHSSIKLKVHMILKLSDKTCTFIQHVFLIFFLSLILFHIILVPSLMQYDLFTIQAPISLASHSTLVRITCSARRSYETASWRSSRHQRWTLV